MRTPRTHWLILATLALVGSARAADLDVITRSLSPEGIKEIAYRWDPAHTAIIVCDMWDHHWCKGAESRVGELAPAMNKVLKAARDKGVFIIHAPSSCMAPYKGHPGRKRAQSAPKAANLPPMIDQWCNKVPAEEKARYPIDQADGGCDCSPRCPQGSPWKSQVAAIEIKDEDAISDSGVEIWNLLEDRKLDNIILMGVHTNMCVSGRPFGLRQMAKNGKNVVLVRDLTDTMYNSRTWPYVAHHEGTARYIAYVESTISPTILSTSLTGAAPFQFSDKETRPRAVFLIGDDEYKTETTLPAFAEKELEPLRVRCTFIVAPKEKPHEFAGIVEALKDADLLVVSTRRRAPTAEQMAAIRDFVASGKPVVGIRTASHAFDARGKAPEGHAEWKEFDASVLGGNYHGHHPVGPETKVKAVSASSEGSPILRGVAPTFVGHGSLYQVSPLASGTQPILMGAIPGAQEEPVAWVRESGKSRIAYTSLGHPDDFGEAGFRRLLRNMIFWALDRQPSEE